MSKENSSKYSGYTTHFFLLYMNSSVSLNFVLIHCNSLLGLAVDSVMQTQIIAINTITYTVKLPYPRKIVKEYNTFVL